LLAIFLAAAALLRIVTRGNKRDLDALPPERRKRAPAAVVNQGTSPPGRISCRSAESSERRKAGAYRCGTSLPAERRRQALRRSDGMTFRRHLGGPVRSRPSNGSKKQMLRGQKIMAGIAADAASCQRCPLYRNATQTVFGKGSVTAPIMLVGEQPGDSEDKAGLPFIGPAGRILDRALEQAGIDRDRVYVTNAVKHFKSVTRGKRRIHQRPNTYEIERCRWWLDLELGLVKPRVTVALGATAARALAGRTVAISKSRGRPINFRDRVDGFITVHPSYILRLRDEAKEAEYRRLVADLRRVADLVPEALISGRPAKRHAFG
jgi:uracil-DNA glycosylase family protein